MTSCATARSGGTGRARARSPSSAARCASNLRHSFPLLTTKRVFWRGAPPFTCHGFPQLQMHTVTLQNQYKLMHMCHSFGGCISWIINSDTRAASMLCGKASVPSLVGPTGLRSCAQTGVAEELLWFISGSTDARSAQGQGHRHLGRQRLARVPRLGRASPTGARAPHTSAASSACF